MIVLPPVVILPVMSFPIRAQLYDHNSYLVLFTMRFKTFEFNLKERIGSISDFVTLFSLAIGYIAINGLNSTGFQ